MEHRSFQAPQELHTLSPNCSHKISVRGHRVTDCSIRALASRVNYDLRTGIVSYMCPYHTKFPESQAKGTTGSLSRRLSDELVSYLDAKHLSPCVPQDSPSTPLTHLVAYPYPLRSLEDREMPAPNECKLASWRVKNTAERATKLLPLVTAGPPMVCLYYTSYPTSPRPLQQ